MDKAHQELIEESTDRLDKIEKLRSLWLIDKNPDVGQALIDELTDELVTLGEIVVLLSDERVVAEAQRQLRMGYC